MSRVEALYTTVGASPVTVWLPGIWAQVEVIDRSGSSAVFARVDGVAPTVDGAGAALVPPGGGTVLEVDTWLPLGNIEGGVNAGKTRVDLVAEGSATVEVRGVARSGRLSTGFAGAAGGGGGPIPNPLPVTMTQTPTAWISDQRPVVVGPAVVSWPDGAVEYSVQVVEGEATLRGGASGDVPMTAGTTRRGGIPVGGEEADTLAAWATLEVAEGGSVVLAFTLRA